MNRELNFIGGQWVEPLTGRWRSVENPATGQIIAEVPDSGAEDANRAVEAARHAFAEGPWPRLTPEERRDVLLRLADLFTTNFDRLVDLVCADAGSTVRLAHAFQASIPVQMLRGWAEQALLLKPGSYPISQEPVFGQSELVREPVGVVAGFTPFNFPLFLNLAKAAPALAMGNTFILKPSPITPLIAGEMARACEEAGIPPGVFNVVYGDLETGRRLVEHPDVDMVSFTGSTNVGRQIMAGASGTVKKVVLELGGKSPSLVLDDANLELATQGTLFGCMFHSGQGCVNTTRMLVPSSRYDEVLDLLSARASSIVVGPPTDPTSDIGPVVSSVQLQRIEQYVASAVQDGAKVLVGGRRPAGLDSGYYFEPTVLVDVRPDMSVAQEEIFGPVLSVIRYESIDEAIAIANGTIYGLGAAVWGDDLRRARDVAAQMRAGSVWVNDFAVVGTQWPFGGYKQSGIGREFGPEGALEFTELKHFYTSLDQNEGQRPYGPLICSGWNN